MIRHQLLFVVEFVRQMKHETVEHSTLGGYKNKHSGEKKSLLLGDVPTPPSPQKNNLEYFQCVDSGFTHARCSPSNEFTTPTTILRQRSHLFQLLCSILGTCPKRNSNMQDRSTHLDGVCPSSSASRTPER